MTARTPDSPDPADPIDPTGRTDRADRTDRINRAEPTDPGTIPPEWLAAYADGELDAAERAAVERWLTAHPEAWADLEVQRLFSPANAVLWERVVPPEPSPAAWDGVRRRIDAALGPHPPVGSGRKWRAGSRLLGGLALVAATAAAVAWVAFRPVVVPPGPQGSRPAEVVRSVADPAVAPPPRPAPPDRLAPPDRHAPAAVPRPALLTELGVLALATDDEVTLERVPNTGRGWLPVGRGLLPEVLVLATADEVKLEEVAPSPAWPTGGPKVVTGPGDAPMIYAAKPR